MHLLIMDVDGTLTDGKINIGNNGELFKSFDVKDGYAISSILPKYNIIPVIITGRESIIVENRCRELGITELYQKCLEKHQAMLQAAHKYNIIPEKDGILYNVAYIGDDAPDLECMKAVELSGCPADAYEEVLNTAKYVCKHNGGNGAVREFIEWIIIQWFKGD